MFYEDPARRAVKARQEARYVRFLQQNAKKRGDNLSAACMGMRRRCFEAEVAHLLSELKREA
jgi:hypothetical protein